MKNSILILTIIFLSGILCFSTFTIVKQNKELKLLQSKLSEQEQETFKPKAEIQPIEKSVQDCMKKEDYTTGGMSKCLDDSINDWNKEIDRYLSLLKETLPEEQYDLLKTSQNKWEDYKKAQWAFLNAAIGKNQGTMYINVLSGDRADVVEKRAKDLSGLYFELTD